MTKISKKHEKLITDYAYARATILLLKSTENCQPNQPKTPFDSIKSDTIAQSFKDSEVIKSLKQLPAKDKNIIVTKGELKALQMHKNFLDLKKDDRNWNFEKVDFEYQKTQVKTKILEAKLARLEGKSTASFKDKNTFDMCSIAYYNTAITYRNLALLGLIIKQRV